MINPFWTVCLVILSNCVFNSHAQYQDFHQGISSSLKTETLVIDLEHKFSIDQEFKPRGSIQVKPKTDYRSAQANWLGQQNKLSQSDLKTIREANYLKGSYFLRASLRNHNKTTQTLVRSCSILNSKLSDIITINLSPLNEFISINLITTDPECSGEVPAELPDEFKSIILIQSGSIGPIPDTATYIKRLEEERQSKLRESKEDNRSFFAKYWMYIMPAVIFLMIFSGPAEQGPGSR